MISARRKEVDSSFKMKMSTEKKKIDEVELGDSEGEEEVPIKWRDYEIETLIAICGEIEEDFAKSTRKQGMNSYIKNIDFFYKYKKSYSY